MNGLILIGGVISSLLAVLFMMGGLVLVIVGLLAPGQILQDASSSKDTMPFVGMGSLNIVLAILMGVWPRPEAWIVTATCCIVGFFVLTVITLLEEDPEEARDTER